MSLERGTRLGPYEIEAALGAGGMGEVYRATDTRLDRAVAIKALPAEVAEDPDRLARFDREAKLLASLNHPNIAAIYGLEESGGTPFLVLELVEGEDLAARLKGGAVPLEEALAISRQVAEALEEAHERGVVHRDLKPANIKLTPDGKAKVLDFGLAKAYGGEAGEGSKPDLSHSPTMTRQGTEAGMILGTAAYMSPEQARGRPVDKRADIWAFGVVVYEMLTGRQLFGGDTVSDVLASVLRQEIEWNVLPQSVPAELRRLLARCLERNPKNRMHDIADARIVLDELQRGSSDAYDAAARAERPAAARSRSVAAAAAALVLGLAAGWSLRPAPPDAGSSDRWQLALPSGLALPAAEHLQVAVSADGRLQAVVVLDERGASRLLLRDARELEPRLLADTEGAVGPFFSPDGAWIAFFRPGGLFKVPVAGGPPVRLAETAGQQRGGSWGSDGFVYFSPDTIVGLSRVPQGGGPAQPVTRLDLERDERTHRWPEALPEGVVLFTSDTAASSEYYDDARIEAVRPGSGERKVLVENASMARYSPSGHLVFARGGSLFAQPFDPRTLELRGSPALALGGVATDVTTGAAQFALSRSGAALWTPGGSTVSWDIAWVDRQGSETKLQIPSAPYGEVALSPDGTRAALVGGQGGVSDLWVVDLERAAATRLTFGEFVMRPTWSPDGKRLAYSMRPMASRGNRWQLVWKAADGSGPAEVVNEGERSRAPSGFSPDGGTLLYDALNASGTQRDVWMLPLAPRQTPLPLLEGPFVKEEAVVSPDGRFVAYVSDESGQLELYVRPYPSGAGRFQISSGQGTEPRWSRDGRELFYRAAGVLYGVKVDTRQAFSAGKPERLVERVGMAIRVSTYAPAPDGRRFLTFRAPASAVARASVAFDLGFARRLKAGLAALR